MDLRATNSAGPIGWNDLRRFRRRRALRRSVSLAVAVLLGVALGIVLMAARL